MAAAASSREGGRSDHIRVFLRVRPTTRPSGFFAFDEEHGAVRFDVPAESSDLLGPNNSRSKYDFRFDGLFGLTAPQEDVFKQVAEPAVENALAGYNATIFAYGQTGSGKTFTITGGPQRYEDRGIIPRALQRIFQRCEASREAGGQATVWISYLEVYNEQGYDLLEGGGEAAAGRPVPGTKALEELPRVTLREDEYGNVHLGNLSLHRAETEAEALNLLFQGDTNRAICETAMNPVSSRSHCVFTISLEQREEGSPVVKRSKLHLVDLAGSERVHKTGATGTLLREATHINSSLLALRRVIDALHDKASRRGAARESRHVPYRDSTITSVLRDSLGGNCKTAVVATVSAEATNTDESISTCRFAQGVARIRNDASVNLETDPAVLVARLKEQVRVLEAQKAFAMGEAGEEELTDEERARVAEAAAAWARAGPLDESPPDDTPLPDIGGLGLSRITEAFRALRQLARQGGGGGTGGGGGGAASAEAEAEIRDLKATLAQRNHEIAALDGARLPDGSSVAWSELDDKDAAKAAFKAAYPRREELRRSKQALSDKYTEAKAGAAQINRARGRVVELKAAVEELRVKRAMRAVAESEAGGGGEAMAPSDAERGLLVELDEQQRRYTAAFSRLKELKGEIEYTRRLLEAGAVRLQADFEGWFAKALLERRTAPRSARRPAAAAAAPAPALAPARPAAAAAGAESDDVARFYAAKDQLMRLAGNR